MLNNKTLNLNFLLKLVMDNKIIKINYNKVHIKKLILEILNNENLKKLNNYKKSYKEIKMINNKDMIYKDFINWLKKQDKETRKNKLKNEIFNYMKDRVYFFKGKINLKEWSKFLGVSWEGYKLWTKRMEKNLSNKYVRINYKLYKIDLILKITRTFFKYNGVYGSNTIKKLLEDNENTYINLNTVKRYMLVLNLKCKSRKHKKEKFPIEEKIVNWGFPDLINGNWKANKPNKKWFIDEHYIKIRNNKFLYLCAIIDTFNYKIVGYNVSDYKDKLIAINCLNKAINDKEKFQDLILHSDHGKIYHSNYFMKICNKFNIKQSMSPIGVPTGNRPIEKFFDIYKNIYLINLPIKSRNKELILKLTDKIISNYNYKRKQLFLNWMTPHEYGIKREKN